MSKKESSMTEDSKQTKKTESKGKRCNAIGRRPRTDKRRKSEHSRAESDSPFGGTVDSVQTERTC